MYYYPYKNFHRETQLNSYIRFFHASPNAPTVDIYVNGNSVAKNLSYKEFSGYLPLPVGSYSITVYPKGQTTNPILNTELYIPENFVFNVSLIGNPPNVSLYPIPEPVIAQNFGRPCLRFINLSPNAPAIDVTLSDGTKVFNNVGFKDITNYACIPSGTYTFTGSTTGTDQLLFTVPNVNLEPNNYYSIYAVGLAEESPALEAIAVSEPR